MAVIFSVVINGVDIFTMSDVQERCAQRLMHGITRSMRQVVDEEPAIDSANMRLFGRRARSFPLRFTGEREHASVAEALQFAAAHPITMPNGVHAAAVYMGGTHLSYAQGSVRGCDVNVDGRRTLTVYDLIFCDA